MTNLEKDFPRGGKQKHQPKLKGDGERNLFQTKPDRRRKRRNDDSSRSEPAGPPVKQKKPDDLNLAIADVQPLAPELLTDPFKVLAAVTDVQEHQLLLSLPGGYMGSVPITNISDPLSKNVKNYLSSKEESHVSNFPSLSEKFSTGTLVAARITDTVQKGKKKSIFLSLNPNQVNDLIHLQDLQSGMVLSAAVKSHEDHGYVMDIGIKNLHAFLRNEDAEKFIRKRNKGQPLQIGRVLPCAVQLPDSMEDGTTHTILLHADPKKVAKAVVQDESRLNLRNLLPGMQVAAKVTKVCANGLCVSLGELQGLVYKFHLRHAWDLPSKFRVGETVVGLVLFVHPLLKMFYMNLQTHLDLGFPKDLFVNMKRGEVIDDAVVTGTEKNSVHFKLANSHHAVCSFKKDTKLGKNLKRLSKRFHVGSSHKCQVVKFARIDNVVIIDTNQEVLKEEHVSYDTMKPGDTVECTIKRFPKTGIEVQIGHSVTGFIPYLHTADYPLQEPAKKFRQDQKLTCKVVKVDSSQHQLILTNKRSLISSALPPLTSYTDAHPGLLLQGIVGKILGSSLLLVFYNDVKGIVKTDDLQRVGISDPSKSFFIGQVVTCQVVRCFPESQKLFLTLRDRRAVQDISFDRVEIGKIYECVVVEVTSKGLTVKIDEDKKACIPVIHLSDHIDHCAQLLETYREGDSIPEVVGFLNLTENIVSLKPSLLAAAKRNEFHPVPEMLEVGSSTPCLLLPPPKKGPGAPVQLPGGTVANIARKYYPNINDDDDLTPGLALVAKVKGFSHDPILKLQLDGSLSSCSIDDTTASVELLEEFFKDQERIHNFHQHADSTKKAIASIHVADVVKLTVTRRTELGLLGCIENDIPAICPAEFSKDVDCDVGMAVVAVVLNVDLVSNCVELDLRPRSIKYVQREKKRQSEVKVGHALNADALLIKKDFVLMMLKGHAWGHLAYIPTRKHLNDIVGNKDLYTIGESYKVEVKSVAPGRTIAVLHAHEHPKEILSQKRKVKKRRKSSQSEETTTIDIGKVYTARVKSVAANHVNLVFPGNVTGRAFVTELVDDIKDGQNPLLLFHPERPVQAYVLAKEYHQLHSDFPITRPGEQRLIVECSLKPSVVNSSRTPPSELKLHEGQKVLGVVKQIAHSHVILHLSPTMTGKVDILNTSEDPKAVKEYHKWLTIGSSFHATVVRADPDDVQLTLTNAKSVNVGSLINGWVVSCRPGIGALLRLPFGYRGRLCITDLADQYENSMRQLQKLLQHRVIRVAVIAVDTATQMAAVSFRKSRLQPGLSLSILDPELISLDSVHLSLGSVVRGFVKAVSAKFSRTLVTIGTQMEGFIPWPTSHASNEHPVTQLNVGTVVTVKVKSIGHPRESDIELVLVDSGEQIGSVHDLSRSNTATKSGAARKRKKRCSLSLSDDLPQHSPLVKVAASQLEKESVTQVVELSTVNRKQRKRASVSISEDVQQDSLYTQAETFQEVTPTAVKKKRRKKSLSLNEDQVVPVQVAQANLQSSKKKEKSIFKISPAPDHAEESLSSQLEKLSTEVVHDDDNDDNDDGDDDNIIPTTSIISNKLLVTIEENKPAAPCLEVDAPFRWGATIEEESKDSGLSSDDDDEDSSPVKKHKRLKPAENMDKVKQKAKVDAEGKLPSPQSADELNRLVLASPNSSGAWLKNIAYYLDNGEVDRARAIAEKALKIIHYREERERLNVWVGMLNLENLHGTEESLDDVLQRALKNCDPLKVYRQLANIYARTNKIELAEQTFNVMVKKFSTEREAWIAFLLFLMEHGRLESARNALQRSLRSLPERHHVDMVSRMAQLEYRLGEPERGRTLFESTLVNYPKRTDLWSVYIDMEVKNGAIDSARRILERVTTMSLGVKQMKFFFKKFMDLEKRFGDEASQAHVKEKALEYVESRTTVSESATL